MPARRHSHCRFLACLAYFFGGIMVATMGAALTHHGARPLILYTTVSIISAAACGLCIMGWMFRKWVMPLSIAWNLASREAQRQAVERGQHLAVVRGGSSSLT